MQALPVGPFYQGAAEPGVQHPQGPSRPSFSFHLGASSFGVKCWAPRVQFLEQTMAGKHREGGRCPWGVLGPPPPWARVPGQTTPSSTLAVWAET